MRRREFLHVGAASAAGLIGSSLLADTARASFPELLARPIRVRGRVRSDGRGIARVAVTDGLSVVDTAADGTFELVSSTRAEFVSVSLPSGYAIPRNPTGTARLYQPLAPSGDEAEVVYDLTRLDASDERHAFHLLADVQTEDQQEMDWFHAQSVPDVQATIRELGDVNSFGIACGDIMYDNLELYPQYEDGVRRMGIPFFQVLGNHDVNPELTDRASSRTFTRHFGPRYYSFNRGAVHYVVLDDVFWYGDGYIGYLDADQLAWLEADLQRVERGSTVIVALHIPVLGSRHVRVNARRPEISISVTNRDLLYRLLDPFRAHVLSGHTHESEHVFEHGVHEHVNGAVCGTWWSGPICGDGTPSGYSVYEVRGEEVRWTYKATGHPVEYQIRAYPRGSDPKAPDELVANVWDWDPEWRVVWYEDGDRKGEMSRRVGHDPMSVELHTGPELPERRTWVEPLPVGHLFYAPVSPDAREVRVEATDRFGRMYSTMAGRAG
jgi:3',5'-cyclic AMP phosphodiesterase CpdA